LALNKILFRNAKRCKALNHPTKMRCMIATPAMNLSKPAEKNRFEQQRSVQMRKI
jgi:hypothetical protein